MFRELRYGVMFFLSAAAGGWLGLTLVTRPRGGTIESQMQEDVTAIVCGTLAGSFAWLAYKYLYLTSPPKSPA